MKLLWNDFKAICVSKNLVIQMDENATRYVLWTVDGSKEYRCSFFRDGSADQTDFEANFKSKVNRKLDYDPPFASKTIGSNNIFRRKHGYGFNLNAQGEGSLQISAPYNHSKINELQVINCKALDILSLKVLDRAINPISGYPSIMLNQFGFSVRTCADFFEDVSDYDADIYKDMIILIEYKSDTPSFNIGINIVFHEVKP